VAADAIDGFLTTRSSMLQGTLRDGERLDELDDTSVLLRRAGSICELRPRGDRVRALLGDRELDMPGWLFPAMDRVRQADRFTLAELADVLGDPQSRLVLVRRLIREGMLGVAE
jgi:hypothetical protein